MPTHREQLTRSVVEARATAYAHSAASTRAVYLTRDFFELLDAVIAELDALPPEHTPKPPARCTCFDPEHALALRTEALRTAPHTPIPHLPGCPIQTVDPPPVAR